MEQTRILALGDLHIKTSNIPLIDIFLEKIRLWLDNNSVDIIIVLGDVLDSHERLHTSCLNKAIEYAQLLTKYCKTYFIVGNHDAVNNSIFLTPQHWLNCLKTWRNITVVDTVVIERIKGSKIVLCPYVPDGKFIEALNMHKEEWRDASCIFSHVTIKGANMGTVIAQDADTWDLNFPLLISGHIHLKQWLAPNMLYAGSIFQVAADEPAEKIVVLATIYPGDRRPDIEEIDLCLPKKKILYINIDELDNFEIPSELNFSYIIYISGNYPEFKAFRKTSKYRELTKDPRIIKLVFKAEKKDNTIDKSIVSNNGKIYFENIIQHFLNQAQDPLISKMYDSLCNDLEDITDNLENVLVIKNIERK